MTLITAHSGCDDTVDNSLEYIEYALNSNCNCFEVDVRKDKAGNLILAHDYTDEGVKLKQVFQKLFFSDKLINCDLKDEGIELEVLNLARECNVENKLIFSGTVNLKLIEKNNFQLGNVNVFLNIENFYKDYFFLKSNPIEYFAELPAALDNLQNYDVLCINVNYMLCNDNFLNLLESKNIKCSAWTVNDESEIKRLISKNIFNITTRNLMGALKIKKSFSDTG